jgi:TP901 family phage tail tape measure protein
MPEREVTILAKLTDNMSGPLRGIRAAFGKIGAAARKAANLTRGALRGVGRAISVLRRGLFNLRNLLVAGVFAGILKVFADFERGLANVATLVDTTTVSMEELGEAVLAVSRETGEGLDSLNAALFDIISAGVQAEHAGAVLLEASKLAEGGATSTAAATKGLVSVMNAYGLSVEDATELSDAFFQAQKAGITTIDQLARSVGKVAPTAKLAGLSIDEFLAAISAVTKQGVSTNEAVTGVRSVMNALIKPTEGAQEAARKLGIQFDSSRLKGGRFKDFLAELAEVTELDERVLSKLFPNIKAFATVANLAANDVKDFNDILASMEDKAGATAEAVAKVEETTSQKFKKMLAEIKIFFVGVGGAAKPFVDDIIERIRAFFRDLNSRRNQVQAFLKIVFQAIGQIGRIIGKIFSEGDTVKFITNIITGAIEAGIKIVIAAIPTLVALARRIGREFAIALIDSIFGTSNEAIARRLASGKRGFFRAGLRALGITEEEAENLAAMGRQLKDLESGLGTLQARTLRTGATDVDRENFKKTKEAIERTRRELGGSAFAGVSESDQALLRESTKMFLENAKQVGVDFLKDLPSGLSDETKKAMEELGEIVGPEFDQAMADAIAADDKIRDKAAKEAGKDLAESVSEGIGTGVQVTEGGADVSGMMAEIEIGVDRATSSMQEFRQERARIMQLAEGGFITQTEAVEREKLLIENTTAEIDRLQERIQATREAASAPLLKLIGEELDEMSAKLAGFKEQLKDLNASQGDFFTGFQAGLLQTMQKMGDLRMAGLQLGQSLAGALGDGIVIALTKGREALREYAVNFLKQMAEMILKALIFRAIMAGLGAAGIVTANTTQTAGAGQGFAAGGPVPGPNVDRDVVPAMLTPGEFVQPRGVVDYYGTQVMEALRRRLIPRGALTQFGRTVRPIPQGGALQAGGQASPAGAGPVPAYMVADDDTMDRMLNGGEGAFFEFLRRRADTINGLLRSDG